MKIDNPILDRWAAVIGTRPGRPAVFDPAGRPLLSLAAVEDGARAWGHRLATATARPAPGEVVGLRIGNHPEWPAILLALFRAALIPLPLSRQMASSELAATLGLFGARWVVGLDPANSPALLAAPATDHARRPAIPAACAFIKRTSGTTAAPSAVLFSAAQLVADCDHVCDGMGLAAADLNYGAIPFAHSYGFSNLITPLLCRGIPLVTTDDCLPRAIIAGLHQTGATVFPGMPVFFGAMARVADGAGRPDLPALRLCISAGAPLSPAVATEFAARFRHPIHPFYGSSECGGIAYDDSAEPAPAEGFVGRPLPGITVTPLGPDRIEVRSAAVGIASFPVADPARLGGGRFIPDDLAQLDPAGIWLRGRVSDTVNVAGRKLNPREVEVVLARIPGVREVVVFGCHSAPRTEDVVAAVVGAIAPAALRQQAHALLSAWQVPRDFWFLERLPVTERGKISRRELADRYREFRAGHHRPPGAA